MEFLVKKRFLRKEYYIWIDNQVMKILARSFKFEPRTHLDTVNKTIIEIFSESSSILIKT